MTGRVRFTEAAEAEIDDAVTWYAAKRPELSLDFLKAVNEVVDRIARNPLAFPVRMDDIRQANVRRFPYGLWYVVFPDESVVISALHQRRDPGTVRKRRKLEP